MIGSINAKERSAVVIGGGAAGLLSAYFLGRSGFEVKLIEASERLGGMIRSTDTDHALVERAANSLIETSELREICRDIDIELMPIARDSQAKFILRQARLRKFPLGLLQAVGLVLRGFFVPASENSAQANAYDWACRHLGQGAADFLIQPMVTGIYGARAQDLCWQAAFPRLALPPGWPLFPWLLFGRAPSAKTRRVVVAPKEGMESWTAAIAQQITEMSNVEVCLGEAVDALPQSSNIVLTVPAPMAARLIAEEGALATALAKVRYSPMVSVGVVYRSPMAKQRFRGLGTLIPPSENRQLLGILYSSACFPNRVKDEDETLVTCMIGGGWRPELLDYGDDEIRRLVASELREIFSINEEPVEMTISRWPQAIPLYSHELARTWQLAERSWCRQPGRVLFGNYTGEVSLRGMLQQAATKFGRL